MKIQIHIGWFFFWFERNKKSVVTEWIFKVDLYHRVGIINLKITTEEAV